MGLWIFYWADNDPADDQMPSLTISLLLSSLFAFLMSQYRELNGSYWTDYNPVEIPIGFCFLWAHKKKKKKVWIWHFNWESMENVILTAPKIHRPCFNSKTNGEWVSLLSVLPFDYTSFLSNSYWPLSLFVSRGTNNNMIFGLRMAHENWSETRLSSHQKPSVHSPSSAF